MQTQLSVSDLLELLETRIQLTRISHNADGSSLIDLQAARTGRALLLGTLNLIHCNQIQIIGQTERDYICSLDSKQLETTLDWLFSCDTQLVVFVDNTPVDDFLKAKSEETGTTLVSTPISHFEVITQLRHVITERLADRTTEHGVLMEVAGIGVLLVGEPGVGKSELALELVSRGHRLIADDAPIFAKTSPDTLRGECPELLQDFLEVRGLGVLDIRRMYGDNAIKPVKNLELIVRLEQCDPQALITRNRWPHEPTTRDIIGIPIQEVTVPVAPGRNLAILVEAAARNHLLRTHGYDSISAFTTRLREQMDNASS